MDSKDSNFLSWFVLMLFGAICLWAIYNLISFVSSDSNSEYVYERVTCYQHGNTIFDEVLHYPGSNQFFKLDSQGNRVSVPYNNAACSYRRIGIQSK